LNQPNLAVVVPGERQRLPVRGIVLVVEDEAIIRMGAVQIVEDAGYAGIEASCAVQAMTILSIRSDICVVFTDINMPGTMNGLDLARSIRDRWPSIGVILTSGKVFLNGDDLSPDWRYIRKPYEPSAIAAALSQLLG
jgi:CheY-like chemotaxis protein